MKNKRIVIKVGTSVITKQNGLLNKVVMAGLASQIIQLKKRGLEIVLVSSGAMGAARPLIKLPKNSSKMIERQMLSSIGQIRLINTYDRLFSKYNCLCAQVLATKEDFRDRRHYLNMKNCFEALLDDRIIPIVNENDVVSVDELMFTDNDELAGMVASMLNADALILLSSVDGLLDCRTKENKVIPVVDGKMDSVYSCVTPDKSAFGRGGMLTKCRIAERLAHMGITTHIANGTTENVLLDILDQKKIGTTFVPQKRISGLKKWIASAEGQEKGAAVVNDRAVKILTSKEKAVSLLPVGIIKIEGVFEKGDVIKVKDERGQSIALGVAEYSSKKAKKIIGKSGGKSLIHYDHLFLKP